METRLILSDVQVVRPGKALNWALVFSERLTSWRSSPFVQRVIRYTAGSVFALATSVIVFAVLDWQKVSTTACSIIAFVAGAIPNWILNRKWAWQMEGKLHFGREIVGYLGVSLIALAASSEATGFTQGHIATHFAPGTGLRVIIVTGAYVAVQAVLFVLKFLVYEHWVFAGRSRFRAALRSRHQVWMAARANRTP
jgi:putative flippase GtrA